MIGGMYAASSAMRAYSTVMDVTGNNIANVNTRGFTAKSATLAEQSPSGVKVSSIRDASIPAPHIQSAYKNSESFIAHRMSNVDVGREKLNEIVSLRSVQANSATIRTTDDMLGTIINMKA